MDVMRGCVVCAWNGDASKWRAAWLATANQVVESRRNASAARKLGHAAMVHVADVAPPCQVTCAQCAAFLVPLYVGATVPT